MRGWFESLEQREQLFVAGGSTVGVVLLLYALIWLPLDKHHRAASESVVTWERSLAELRPLKGMQIPASGSRVSAPAGAGQTPVVIVDQTLRARGLDRSLQRSQPTTSSGIRVEFENVAFDDLVLWLGDLSSQYAMEVTSGSFSAGNISAPGRVNATLTLERSL
jgi:general secretion pathway protein M